MKLFIDDDDDDDDDDNVVLCHTLPVFTGLGRCPIVSWDFAGAVSIFWTGCPFLSSTNDFTRIRNPRPLE